MKITESLLRQHATAKSFERGERYFEEGAVRRVVRHGDIFSAQVEGSELYIQHIDVSGAKLVATCTCPYDHGGYCKHIVAVGLAILEGKYSKGTEYRKEKQNEDISLSEKDISQTWGNLPNVLKLQFLKKALRHQPSLGVEFVRYAQATETPVLTVSHEQITQSLVETLAQLDMETEKNLDLHDDEIPENWEWEKDNDGLDDQIGELLAPLETQIKTLLRNHQWADSFALLIGIYEGFLQAEKQPNTDWGYHSERIWANYFELHHLLIDALGKAILAPAWVRWALKLLFNRWDFYEQRLSLHALDRALRYHWRDWILMGQVIVQDKPSAQFLARRLEAYELSGSDLEVWKTHINRIISLH